jgi:hypothetical protein
MVIHELTPLESMFDVLTAAMTQPFLPNLNMILSKTKNLKKCIICQPKSPMVTGQSHVTLARDVLLAMIALSDEAYRNFPKIL